VALFISVTRIGRIIQLGSIAYARSDAAAAACRQRTITPASSVEVR
jgi:hypothetical protein